MLTKAPACRLVCKDKPGVLMEELVAALVKLRKGGLSEADALALAEDKARLPGLFPNESLGRLPAVAESLVESECARCAVNKAYSAALDEKVFVIEPL